MALIHRQVFPPAETWDAASIALQLRLPGGFGLICGSGFLLARALGSEAEILTLAVLAPARRQGIGRGLLAAALSEAAKRGADAIFLDVAENNVAARTLYENFGARVVGRRRAYYPQGDDALVLRIGTD